MKLPAIEPEQAVIGLAQAMTELGRHAELRHAMGQAGRERVRCEYLGGKKGDRLDALYASVLERQ